MKVFTLAMIPVAAIGGFLLGMSLHRAPIVGPKPDGNIYTVSVTSVYDGDTFSFNMTGLPPELNPLKIRLRGVDTPERGAKAKCASERDRADRARQFTLKQINETNGRIVVKNLRWDKYGGRVDADVYVGEGYHDLLTQRIIAAGYGREYHGEARTIGWCGI